MEMESWACQRWQGDVQFYRPQFAVLTLRHMMFIQLTYLNNSTLVPQASPGPGEFPSQIPGMAQTRCRETLFVCLYILFN